MYIGPWQELRLGRLLKDRQRLIEQAAAQQVELIRAQQRLAQLAVQRAAAAAAEPPPSRLLSPTRSLSSTLHNRTRSPHSHARIPRRRRPESATLPPLHSSLTSPHPSHPSHSLSHTHPLPSSSSHSKAAKPRGHRAHHKSAAVERVQHLQRLRALYNLDGQPQRKEEEEHKEAEDDPTALPAGPRSHTSQASTARGEKAVSPRVGQDGLLFPPAAGASHRPGSPSAAFSHSQFLAAFGLPSPHRPMSAEDFLRNHMDVEVEHRDNDGSPSHPPEVDPSASEWASMHDIRVRQRPLEVSAADLTSSSVPASLLPEPVDVALLPLHDMPPHLSQTYQRASATATELSNRRTRQRREMQLIDDVIDALHSEEAASAKLSLCQAQLSHLREEEGGGGGSWQASVDLLEHWHAVLMEATQEGSGGSVALEKRLMKAEARLEEALRLREEELRTGVEATAEALRRVREHQSDLEWRMQQSLRLRPGSSTTTPTPRSSHAISAAASPQQPQLLLAPVDGVLPPLKSSPSSATSSSPGGRSSLTFSSPPSSSDSGQQSADQSPRSLSIFRMMRRGGAGEACKRLQPIQVQPHAGRGGDEISSASLRMEAEVEDVMRFVDGVSDLDSD